MNLKYIVGGILLNQSFATSEHQHFRQHHSTNMKSGNSSLSSDQHGTISDSSITTDSVIENSHESKEKEHQQHLERDGFTSPISEPSVNNYDELKWGDKPLDGNHDTFLDHDSSLEHKSKRQKLSEPDAKHEHTKTYIDSLPIRAETTALLIVDVQPEYWSSAPSVRKDFPNFEANLARTIATARKNKCKIIWVRADYRKQHSPWLKQFERLKRLDNRPDTMVELPCDPEDEEFGWEDFATPGE